MLQCKTVRSVADPDPGSGAFLTPWKKSGIWDEQPRYFSESLETVFVGLQIPKFIDRDLYLESF
jgi:hypothetical protein